MNTSEHWKWLMNFANLLELQTEKLNPSLDPKGVAELRIAERTLNMCIDQFMHIVRETEGKSVGAFLEEQGNGRDLWNGLKNKRDAIANRLSGIIESDVKIEERYTQYCEDLKKHRSLGAML